jgi:DNA processing protein
MRPDMGTIAPPALGTAPGELKYWVALSRIPGIGRVRYQSLLGAFGNLSAAWTAGPSDLRAAGVDSRATRLIAAERSKIDPDDEMEQVQKQGVQALTWLDPLYPAALKEIDDLPPVVYVRGDISPAHDFAVAVVGTRRPTPYGRQVAEEMSYQLAANRICVVSGLARGVDAIAHRAALQAGARPSP